MGDAKHAEIVEEQSHISETFARRFVAAESLVRLESIQQILSTCIARRQQERAGTKRVD